MRYKSLFLLWVVLGPLVMGMPNSAQAAFPMKAKALLTTCAYGTVGGALLGLASMAFGSKPIAVAQGASIGLWSGLIFGSYIVLSHQYQQNQNRIVSPGDEDQEAPVYPGGTSPYDEAGAVEVDTYAAPKYREDIFSVTATRRTQVYGSHPWAMKMQERRGTFNLINLSF